MRYALVSTFVLISFALAAPSRADIAIEVANGQKVRGTIDPVTEMETLTLCIPGGSTLTVTVKGKKEKGGNPAPVVTFKVLDAGDAEISAGKVIEKGVGAKLKKLPILTTGKYRVVIEAASVGNYEAKVKWKSPKKVTETLDLSVDSGTVAFAIDADATCTFQAKASKKSDAEPVLNVVELDGGGTVHTFTAPAVGASKHKEKNVAFGDFGGHSVLVSSDGVGGNVDVSIKIKAPKPDKKQIVEITAKQIASDDARGKVIGPSGGTLSITEGVLGDLVGTSIIVAPGALGKPTAIIIGSGLGVPVDGQEPGGPAVFFGPDGLQFGTAGAQIILPFNPGLFNEEGDVQVAVKDEHGNIALVAVSDFTIDLEAGTATVNVAHLSEYQVVGSVDRVIPPTTIPGDLNGDRFADIVIPTGSAFGSALKPNNIQVIFGRNTPATALSTEFDVDAIFTSGAQFDVFGQHHVVADITGDGQDDLIIANAHANGFDGAVHIFSGGPGFASSSNPFVDADVTIGGEDESREQFGASLCVGDVIGDARLDLVVSSRGSSPNNVPTVFVFDGNNIANGLSGSADATITGEAFTALVVRACGNVMGTAHDDLILQQQFGDGGNSVYVFAGGSSLPLLDPSDLSSASAVIASPDEQIGTLALVADLLGDPTGDLVLFDPAADDFNGAVWVFEGGAAFASTDTAGAVARVDPDADSWQINFLLSANLDVGGREQLVLPDFQAADAVNRGGAAYIFRDQDLTGVTNQSGAFRSIVGTEPGAAFGTYAGKGDVNGDGRMDIYFASPFSFGPPGDPTGAVHVFYGVPDVTSLPLTDNTSNLTIQGQTQELLGNQEFETPQ